MKNSRIAYIAPVGAAVLLLVLSLVVYAGILSSAWGTLLACVPAILAMTGIVAAMLCGMFFFEAEEDETPQEAARLDGTSLFDSLGQRIPDLLHRTAIGLHVRGLGR